MRKRRARHSATADSLKEAGDASFTFTRLPASQPRSAQTTNAIQRLDEEFKRRVNTLTVLPSSDAAAMPFWALFASGQVIMRKAMDGKRWQHTFLLISDLRDATLARQLRSSPNRTRASLRV